MGFGLNWASMDRWSSDYLKKNLNADLLINPNDLDPSNARLSAAKLLKGGRRPVEKKPETRVGFAVAPPNGVPVAIKDDWRVRVSLSSSNNILYNSQSGILAPLKKTMGVVFPYTPAITTAYSASYGTLKPVHSIYPAYFYESSDTQAINLSGEFTVQTPDEGQYLLACIYFFRTVTKMFYGAGTYAGNPPPIVFLNGYGQHYFPNVPCVITSFTHVLSADVDYLEIPAVKEDPYSQNDLGMITNNQGKESGGKATKVRLPTSSQLQVVLQPVYSRNTVAEFDLEKFANGDLLDRGFI